MHRFLLALCTAMLLMVAAISPTFAQEPTTRGGDVAQGYTLLRAMQSDPETARTMTFVMVEGDASYDKIAAAAEEGATESTVCGKTVCVCRPDSHGSCDLFKWLCIKLGGQHTEAATSEGCFF